MKFGKKIDKKNKGFTLVELIVVLVILAILAAILVPALLGYIDRAKRKQYVLNAKALFTAAQANMSELYGTGEPASKLETNKAQVISMADVEADEFVVGCDVAYDPDKSLSEQHEAYTLTYACYKMDGFEYYCIGGVWNEKMLSGYTTVAGADDGAAAAKTFYTYEIISN